MNVEHEDGFSLLSLILVYYARIIFLSCAVTLAPSLHFCHGQLLHTCSIVFCALFEMC